MDENNWSATVSEELPNGSVLITSYVRINDRVYVRMDEYNQKGITPHLDIQLRVKLREDEQE